MAHVFGKVQCPVPSTFRMVEPVGPTVLRVQSFGPSEATSIEVGDVVSARVTDMNRMWVDLALQGGAGGGASLRPSRPILRAEVAPRST